MIRFRSQRQTLDNASTADCNENDSDTLDTVLDDDISDADDELVHVTKTDKKPQCSSFMMSSILQKGVGIKQAVLSNYINNDSPIFVHTR